MGQEIEAKYRLATAADLEILAGLSRLEHYTLQMEDSEEQRNTYYDTAERTLEQQRYGLRIRTVGDRHIATLKGQEEARDGVFQRGEWEVEATDPHPATWPAGEAREKAFELLGEAHLEERLTIRTLRQRRLALRDNRAVAEVSLDEATIDAGGQSTTFREVEIELLPDGTPEDIAALTAALQQYTALIPEQRSKLARGLALLSQA
ncbi:MAG: CYTH domain-containing protein [Chloroflexaceae bacterium]|nr:CYTH domain-containing protein [Chloroflexaceae bacterium]NJL33196.1 CYTH domain-containing protein [Chloroflexaceae bacterium]